MSQVGADGVADDAGLGLRPADADGEQVPLQPQERAQGHADVVPLRLGPTRLAPLRLRVLLDAR